MMTKKSLIPYKWMEKSVIEIFDVKTGSTPPTKFLPYWEGGEIFWYTPADISDVDGKIFVSESAKKITHLALKDNNLNIIPKESILLSTRAPVGTLALTIQDSAFNQGCKGLVPRIPQEVNSKFYYYFFKSKKNDLENRSSGSTFKELSKNMLESYRVPIPPKGEQDKIAALLSTIDNAIQKSKVATCLTERLKKGILHKLLFNGIGHTEFTLHDKFGKIPKLWNIYQLSSISKIRYGLGQPPEISDGGIPMIRATNIDHGHIDINGAVKVRRDKIPVSRDPFLKIGDILVVRSGVNTGDLAMFDKANTEAIAGYDLIITPDSEKIDSRYLVYYLLSDFVQNFFKSQSTRAAQAHLNAEQLGLTKVLVPSLIEEQIQISTIIYTFDTKIALQRKRTAALERLKHGLMNDLLTGKRRVMAE